MKERKKAGETLALSVFNLAVPSYPAESTLHPLLGGDEWVPFGSDNLFPQAIAAINRQSAIHRGILNNKVIYTSGWGFTFDEKNKALKKFLESANNKNEPLHKVIRRLIIDKYHSGNAYLEIVKGKGFINVFHKDYTTARTGKDENSILLHGDWAKVQTKRNEVKRIPLYPAFETIDNQERSILHLKSYEPEFTHYGIPDWVASMDAAGICYKTNKWNISRLDNSFVPSGVLLVEGNISVKEAKKMKADLKKEMVGEGKQGKILFLIKQLGDGNKGAQSIFTPFVNVNDGDWTNLHKQGIQDLIVAHNWFRGLSGLAEPGQLGNAQQIRNEYQIALNTVITVEQEFFLQEIKKILLNELKIDASSLQFINKPPLSLMDAIDIKSVLTQDEQREILGYETLKNAQ